MQTCFHTENASSGFQKFAGLHFSNGKAPAGEFAYDARCAGLYDDGVSVKRCSVAGQTPGSFFFVYFDDIRKQLAYLRKAALREGAGVHQHGSLAQRAKTRIQMIEPRIRELEADDAHAENCA